jgi:hypothetical protein
VTGSGQPDCTGAVTGDIPAGEVLGLSVAVGAEELKILEAVVSPVSAYVVKG